MTWLLLALTLLGATEARVAAAHDRTTREVTAILVTGCR